MMNKLLFAAGIAAGFVLGSKAGRGSYDQIESAAKQLWRAKSGQDPAGSRRSAAGNAAEAVGLVPAGEGAARDQSQVAEAAAHSGPPRAGRRVGSDTSTDDRPGTGWDGGRTAEGVETAGDPEEELGHS
jgi:hypothetical protein